MKSLLCAAALVVCTTMSFSQIPNAGFENWADDGSGNNNPVDWVTTNSNPTISVEPFSPGHTGSLALKVKTVDLTVVIIGGIAYVEAPFAFSELPTKFSAWVKSTIMPGDTAFIIVALMKGDTVIAGTDSCTFKIGTSYADFTYLEFPIGIEYDAVPDSLYVMVGTGLTGNPQLGTEIIVDDIAFVTGGPTSAPVAATAPAAFRLTQNYPNPFNPSTKISFELSEPGFTTLAVYDLLGRQVALLASGFLSSGTHSRMFNAAHLPSGVYVYQLRSGSFQATKRLMVVR